ncbi:MAG: hypothetical protein MRECE_12c022 [Mycoplasmataceae bacterium CE_OT135]|nr:MAG: hypothetical protein MRECE_12c022 [Mycoplasmataceae bacterium CE_OT135]
MTIRQEILQEMQTFLAKENKTKKDYRSFTGNLKRLKETPRLKDLTNEELTTCQQAQEFLQRWQANYDQYPKIFTKEKDLTLLSEQFNHWLKQTQEKTKTLPKSSKPTHPPTTDWDEKLTQAEKGLAWLNWWEKHQTALKFAGTVIALLFIWLAAEKVREKLC